MKQYEDLFSGVSSLSHDGLVAKSLYTATLRSTDLRATSQSVILRQMHWEITKRDKQKFFHSIVDSILKFKTVIIDWDY